VKRTTSRVWLMSAVAVVSSMVMVGCSNAAPTEPTGASSAPGGSLEELVAAAQKEGTVTYYTSQSPGIVEKLVPAFESKYGIHVDLLRLNSGELQQRLIAEGTSSDADLAELPPEFFVSSADLFRDLSTKLVPSLADVPTDLVGDNAVVTSALPWIIGYNTDLVKDVPKTWKDVIDNWKGDYLLTDPKSSNAYMAFVNEIQKAFGDDAVKKLGAGAGQIANSGAAAAQQIAAGEFAITVPNYPGQLTPLIAQGAKVKYVLPQEPAVTLSITAGILENGPHPAAARLLLDWLVSHDGQKALCDTGLAGAILPPAAGLEGCVELPDGWVPYALDVDENRRNELLDLLGL
jgi:iron(III) transport system substrate-binding protein